MKVAFLSNFTISFLAKEFENRFGMSTYVSGYNQYLFDIKNPDSNYYLEKPDFSVLILDWDTVLAEKTLAEVKKEIENIYLLNCSLLNNFFLINNAYLSTDVNSIHQYNLSSNVKKKQCELNIFLTELSSSNTNFFVVDILSIIEKYGSLKIFDSASWFYAKNKFSKFGLTEVAKKTHNLLNGILNFSKKCLVLDLDNTLWGGVLGEDGIDGILLGQGGIGEVYIAFQKAVRCFKEKGVILGICSKNNVQEVEEVFNRHPNMILSLSDFVITKINWNRKDINIKEIAEDLNISEESIVFLDDSPIERELIKQNTRVIVPNFPEHPEDIREFIEKVDELFFPRIVLTQEDLVKTEFYHQNIARAEHKKSFQELEDFIRSLKVSLTIHEATSEHAFRLSQLTQKTNQFNLSTKRYTERDIQSMIKSPNFKVYFGEVSDKFGQYGKVLLLILEIKKNTAHFDTLLMSCRVIGRQVENIFIKSVVKNLSNIDIITAEYIPSNKNQIVETKLNELGFTLTDESSGSKYFSCLRSELEEIREYC